MGRYVMAEFKSSCPRCGKPITTVNDGLVPEHKIGVNRGGKVEKVTCPGSGERPN
jgi:hypothetical protein